MPTVASIRAHHTVKSVQTFWWESIGLSEISRRNVESLVPRHKLKRYGTCIKRLPTMYCTAFHAHIRTFAWHFKATRTPVEATVVRHENLVARFPTATEVGLGAQRVPIDTRATLVETCRVYEIYRVYPQGHSFVQRIESKYSEDSKYVNNSEKYNVSRHKNDNPFIWLISEKCRDYSQTSGRWGITGLQD